MKYFSNLISVIVVFTFSSASHIIVLKNKIIEIITHINKLILYKMNFTFIFQIIKNVHQKKKFEQKQTAI